MYALCDYQTLERFDKSLEDFLQICKKFDTKIIQYRDKINPLNIQKQNLLYLKNNTNIPILINDKIELLEFADGLHLGQEDLLVLKEKTKINDEAFLFKFLKKKYKNKIFGISIHNEIEILKANEMEIDYITLASFKEATTKNELNILGNKITYLVKISKHPVAAMGGVKVSDNLENVTFNIIGSDLYEY